MSHPKYIYVYIKIIIIIYFVYNTIYIYIYIGVFFELISSHAPSQFWHVGCNQTSRHSTAPPTSWNCPRSLLSAAISRSPWCTLISTCVWPSAAVENTCQQQDPSPPWQACSLYIDLLQLLSNNNSSLIMLFWRTQTAIKDLSLQNVPASTDRRWSEPYIKISADLNVTDELRIC